MLGKPTEVPGSYGGSAREKHKAGDKTQLGKPGMGVHACHLRGRWRQGGSGIQDGDQPQPAFQNEIMSKRKRSCLGWGGTVGEARRGSGLVSSTAKYVKKQITEREEKVKVFHKSPVPPRPPVASVVSLASGCISSPALSPEHGHQMKGADLVLVGNSCCPED